MKENGESLKIDLRQKYIPGLAPYILHILYDRGDMYMLLIKKLAKKKQLLKTARIISR